MTGPRLQQNVPKLDVRFQGEEMIVAAHGKITLGAGGFFQNELNRRLSPGCRRLSLDMGCVTYIDRSGVVQLASVCRSAKEHNCEVRILNLAVKVRELISTSPEFKALPLHP